MSICEMAKLTDIFCFSQRESDAITVLPQNNLIYTRVFHKSLNVAGEPARMRVWHPRAPRCGEKNASPSRRAVGKPIPRHAFGWQTASLL